MSHDSWRSTHQVAYSCLSLNYLVVCGKNSSIAICKICCLFGNTKKMYTVWNVPIQILMSWNKSTYTYNAIIIANIMF